MNFTNYSDFRTAVLKMIDGDDAGTGSIAQSTLDLLIALGESRVYLGDGEEVPGLRCADMETALAATVTANLAPLPSDCLGLAIVKFSGEKPLDYMSENELVTRLEMGDGGTSRHYTQQGRSLTFYPSATGTVGGRYYKRPVDIATGGLHATFNRYPECFLFAALAESAPFIGEDSRLPMWKTLFASWVNSANRTERLQASSGSRLTVKAR